MLPSSSHLSRLTAITSPFLRLFLGAIWDGDGPSGIPNLCSLHHDAVVKGPMFMALVSQAQHAAAISRDGCELCPIAL